MRILAILMFIGVFLPNYALAGNESNAQQLQVVATAYTTAIKETQAAAPGITAWGDRLTPGMKAIAVSHDLIQKGLTHNTRVRIKGLSGTFVVLDKMNSRWNNKIDIYMADRAEALEWGKRQVTIVWDGAS